TSPPIFRAVCWRLFTEPVASTGSLGVPPMPVKAAADPARALPIVPYPALSISGRRAAEQDPEGGGCSVTRLQVLLAQRQVAPRKVLQQAVKGRGRARRGGGGRRRGHVPLPEPDVMELGGKKARSARAPIVRSFLQSRPRTRGGVEQ